MEGPAHSDRMHAYDKIQRVGWMDGRAIVRDKDRGKMTCKEEAEKRNEEEKQK